MKTHIKRLLKVLLVFSLFTSLSITNSNADEVLTGDDVTELIDGVTIKYDGIASSVYISTNMILSFGQGTTTFAQYDTNPIVPSIHFYSKDWVVDWTTNRADESMTVTLTSSGFVVDFTGRVFPNNGVGDLTSIQVVATIDGSGNATYTYTVGGTEYTDAREGAVLRNGTVVPLSQVNAFRKVIADFLTQVAAPTLKLSSGVATCNPGAYKFASGGSATTRSLVYTLYVDDKAVSRLVHDPSRSLSPGSYALIDGPTGTASATGATWDLSKLSNYKVYCEVSAHTSGASLSSTTETLFDSAYYAAIEAKKAAEETVRQAALVEFNSKENRELRKRLAARGIRG